MQPEDGRYKIFFDTTKPWRAPKRTLDSDESLRAYPGSAWYVPLDLVFQMFLGDKQMNEKYELNLQNLLLSRS